MMLWEPYTREWSVATNQFNKNIIKRTLQNSDLNAVVGSVMLGDAPSGKTQLPARCLGNQ